MGKKVLPGLFLECGLYAGVFWKGDVLVADLEELETMDASEIYSKKTPCERGDISQRKWNFPATNGQIKLPGGDQDLRTSTLIRDRPIRGESHVDFLGESEGSLLPPHDSFPDGAEAINDFWSISGNFIYRHHVEPRVKLYSPREEPFPVPLKYIDVSRTTHTNLDVKQQRRIDDYWNVDGSRDLFDSWTGFTQFTPKKRNLQTDICGPGERLTRKQLTSRPDFLWPELWEKSHKKPQIDNARKLRGIYVIDPEDKEFKETIKNARKKLETPMAPAMPCKISKNNQNCGMVINTVRTNQNLRLFWKTVNLQGRVWENLYRIIMKTILQEKVTIHCNITIRFTNLFICSKPCKFPQQKKRWTKNGKTWRTFRRGTWRKSEVKKDVIDETRTKGVKVHFASLMDICHLKNAELEAKHQKFKGRSVLRSDIV